GLEVEPGGVLAAEAGASADQWLETFRRRGHRLGEAASLRCLGEVLYGEGRLNEAEAALTRALPVFEEYGDARWQAKVKLSLGDVLRERGDLAGAMALWGEASVVFAGLGAPEAADTQQRLDADGTG